MFIDYLTLMLMNLSAGLVIMAFFVFRFLDKDRKKMVPGFLASGFLALITGLRVIFTWPLPGSYNIPLEKCPSFSGCSSWSRPSPCSSIGSSSLWEYTRCSSARPRSNSA